MIRLLGPGGAGKTTTGARLARVLGAAFVDLDGAFLAAHGDISRFIDAHGYAEYAHRNVDVYLSLPRRVASQTVVALSSGFMTYRTDIHPEYARCWSDIARSRFTFVLLPSLELEMCVEETVRRQLTRPFARSRKGEERVIRGRFAIYLGLPALKIETMRPVEDVVQEMERLCAHETVCDRNSTFDHGTDWGVEKDLMGRPSR